MLLPPFDPFMAANPTLPDLYMQTKSPQQQIAQLYCALEAVKRYDNAQTVQINDNTQDISELQTVADSIANGEYLDKYIDGLASYIDRNLVAFVARLTSYVFPGFYWDGECWHLMFTVPADWKFLRFQFIWVPDDFCYHIVLTY